MKNKLLLFALGTFVSGWMACAQVPEKEIALVAEVPTALIEFTSNEHDFGAIPQNIPAVHVFEFTNNGKEPLVLSNVKGSCQCTVPEWPKEPILPGKSATIKASFNAKNLGKFRKSITVSSNTTPATNVLYIKGDVIPKDL